MFGVYRCMIGLHGAVCYSLYIVRVYTCMNDLPRAALIVWGR